MLSALIKRLARGPSATEALEAGRRALESGDAQKAGGLLTRAAQQAPGNAECAFYAGLAQYRLNAFGEALRWFERAIAANPASAEYRYQAAAAEYMLDRTDAAIRRCEEALARDENHTLSHYLLARLRLPGPPYTELLGAIHQRLAPRTYVEIGISTGRSLAQVLPGTRVVGIDPAPKLAAAPPPNVQVHALRSDEYFAIRDLREDLGGLPVDLAFIDGAHVFEQALRDFINIERCSTPQSTILLHDTYPLDRYTAQREHHSVFWSGDVWRLVLILKKYRPDLTVANVASSPTGLCIVRSLDPQSRVLAESHDSIVEEYLAVDYSVLDADKPGLLNLYPNDVERVLGLVTSG